MKTKIAQIKNPDTTNEDMNLTAGKYVKAVADLIHDEDRSIGDLDKEMVRKFFENVKASSKVITQLHDGYCLFSDFS